MMKGEISENLLQKIIHLEAGPRLISNSLKKTSSCLESTTLLLIAQKFLSVFVLVKVLHFAQILLLLLIFTKIAHFYSSSSSSWFQLINKVLILFGFSGILNIVYEQCNSYYCECWLFIIQINFLLSKTDKNYKESYLWKKRIGLVVGSSECYNICSSVGDGNNACDMRDGHYFPCCSL